MKKKHIRAFTLVEILIVMVLVSLLTIGAIAGGSYAIKQARIKRKIKNVDQISSLLSAYYNENLNYPQIGNITDGTPSTAIVTSDSTSVDPKLPVKYLDDASKQDTDSYTRPIDDFKRVIVNVSLLDYLKPYMDGFEFDNEPCKTSGCYAYARSSSTTTYALCVQLDTKKEIKESNARGDEGEYCYCTGGSNEYDLTCSATNRFN